MDIEKLQQALEVTQLTKQRDRLQEQLDTVNEQIAEYKLSEKQLADMDKLVTDVKAVIQRAGVSWQP